MQRHSKKDASQHADRILRYVGEVMHVYFVVDTTKKGACGEAAWVGGTGREEGDEGTEQGERPGRCAGGAWI